LIGSRGLSKRSYRKNRTRNTNKPFAPLHEAYRGVIAVNCTKSKHRAPHKGMRVMRYLTYSA
jgi:hypothetical protein